MHVVGKDGIGQDIHPEDGGDALKPFTDPFPTKLIVFAGEWVFSGQKGTSDTALDAVDDADLVGFEQFGA
jgi:hypothetical protein